MNVPSSDLFAALAGGLLIGVATTFMMIFSGRIAGVSGIVGGLIPPRPHDMDWRLAFLSGLVGGGALLRIFYPEAFPAALTTPTATLVAAGLLVGYGARLGNGCTSGHGVCGIGRMSRRSLVATAVFLSTGMLTVFVHRHLFGAAS